LEFAYNSDGQHVRLIVGEKDKDRRRIEVVNLKELESKFIPADVTNTFEIIVCKEGEREESALVYYKIIKPSNYRAWKEAGEELAALKGKSVRDNRKIAKLERKVAYLEKQNDSLTVYGQAFKIASINKDNASDRMLRFLEMLEQGVAIDLAIEVLDVKEAVKEARNGIALFKSSIEELEAIVNYFMTKAEYSDAISNLEEIIELHEDGNLDRLIIANYKLKLAKAYELNGDYDKSLELVENTNEVIVNVLGEEAPELVGSYTLLSSLYRNKREFSIALEYDYKAKNILENTGGVDPEELASVYNNIALNLREDKNYESAIEYFEKSLTLVENRIS
jgi:tetratricopeptide (TPR) repeat protein